MNFPLAAIAGFFFGFAFGVGCALAVLYAIYMGGYRAAVRDTQMAHWSERLTRELARLNGSNRKHERAPE